MRVPLAALICLASAPAAQTVTPTREEGLAAWERIFTVTSHPRCSNCHVGDEGRPMWDGLGFGSGRVHGFGVLADESRIGAQSMPCRTCHITAEGDNNTDHAPPQVGEAWRLPPVDMAWLGRSSFQVCTQLRDPDRNGGQDAAGLIAHLESSAFVAWGFAPGAGREPAPGSLGQMVADVALWAESGFACE